MKAEIFGQKESGVSYWDRPGAYAILMDEIQQILLVKTPTGIYLPGGGIEAGEKQEACLVRECAEELGLGIWVGEKIGEAEYYGWSPTRNCALHSVAVFYFVHPTGELVPKTELDHEEVWAPVEEAVSLLRFPHQAWAVQMAFKRLTSPENFVKMNEI